MNFLAFMCVPLVLVLLHKVKGAAMPTYVILHGTGQNIGTGQVEYWHKSKFVKRMDRTHGEIKLGLYLTSCQLFNSSLHGLLSCHMADIGTAVT